MSRISVVVIAIVVGSCAALTPVFAADNQMVFPGGDWVEATPESQGVDSEKLLRAIDELEQGVGDDGVTRLVIVRNGRLIWKGTDIDHRHGIWSCTKSFTSTVLGLLIDDGKARLNTRAKEYLPAMAARFDRVTLRNFTTMTSGYYAMGDEPRGGYTHGPSRTPFNPGAKPLFVPPGSQYAYWDSAMNQFGNVLTRIADQSMEDVFKRRIADPIGMNPAGWDWGDFGEIDGIVVNGGSGNSGKHMQITARQFARFGHLFLNRGNWAGEQLISEDWVAAATAVQVPASTPWGHEISGFDGRGVYGFNWWVNGVKANGERKWPAAPSSMFAAMGHNNNKCFVIPEWGIVVTRLGLDGNVDDVVWNNFFGNLAGAFIDETASAIDATVEAQSYSKWSTIELEFTGPDSTAGGTPNPFAISLDVVFTSPDGNRYRVPGFYDGNGRGGTDGPVWKVRFSADEVGPWRYSTESDNSQLVGHDGTFVVEEVPEEARGFWKWGRLEYTGTPENGIRYLKFRDGPYWMKAGCDDPENFLGNYRNFDTQAKRKAAVDYLASQGINSLYIMTHNVDGDDKDVWPWLGATAAEAKKNGGADARFDVAKLEEWRELFEYMQTRGVVPYLILEDDSAWKRYDVVRYQREIIARFGDLPALVFNLGEEHNENYRLREGLEMARRFKEIDPYNHALGIHNISRANDDYVDSPYLDMTAIQTGQPGRPSAVKFAIEHNQIAVDWIARCRKRGKRILVVNFDEGRPEHDRLAWWSAYIGGGVWEAHVAENYDQPHSAWETTWVELGGARAFMESLPFHEMEPRNDLVIAGDGFCLAKPGAAYAVYLPHEGRVTVKLEAGVRYSAAWWSPDNGFNGQFEPAQTIVGGSQDFQTPGEGDWALRILAVP